MQQGRDAIAQLLVEARRSGVVPLLSVSAEQIDYIVPAVSDTVWTPEVTTSEKGFSFGQAVVYGYYPDDLDSSIFWALVKGARSTKGDRLERGRAGTTFIPGCDTPYRQYYLATNPLLLKAAVGYVQVVDAAAFLPVDARGKNFRGRYYYAGTHPLPVFGQAQVSANDFNSPVIEVPLGIEHPSLLVNTSDVQEQSGRLLVRYTDGRQPISLQLRSLRD